MLTNITIYCSEKNKLELAKNFADTHQLNFTTELPLDSIFYMSFDQNQTVLHDTKNSSELVVDFTSGGLAHRLQYGGGKGQTIAKAIGINSKNKPHILDATAGLGRDAIILANLGCKVSLVEQSPILAEMLKQAIESAKDNHLFQQATRHGFELHNANSSEFMKSKVIPDCDVVYLDPMYPEKKKSALVKKDMQMLQALIGHSSDDTTAELLASALSFAKQRVVVKRPKGANTLNGPAPTMSLHSKKTRYDVYVIKTLKNTNP